MRQGGRLQRFARCCAGLGLAYGLALAGLAPAAPAPDWLRPEFSRRLVLRPSKAVAPTLTDRSDPKPGSCLLVNIPAETGTAPTTFAVVSATNTTLPFRMVHVQPSRTALLLCVGTEASLGEICVYFAPATNTAGQAEVADLRDPEPVALAVYAGPGRSTPDTWDRLRALQAKAGDPRRELLRTGVDAMGTARPGDNSERRLVDVRTVLLCPTNGIYRFASATAGGLLIDDDLVLQDFATFPAAAWRVGPPIRLTAGPHTLRLLTEARGRELVRIGWQPPGAADINPIPAQALVTAYTADNTRIERIDRTLQADFAVEIKAPYGFFGSDVVFIPVGLRNTSRNWLPAGITARWAVDGRPAVDAATGRASDDSLRLVLAGATVHTIELTVRDALGFVASARRAIDCTSAMPRLHELNAVMNLRASVFYPDEEVAPVIRVDGALRSAFAFTVRCRTTLRNGPNLDVVQPIASRDGPTTVTIPPFTGGEATAMAWSLEHEGVAMLREDVRFVTPPSALWPTRIVADRLYDAFGHRLVLVAADAARARHQPRITTTQAFGRIACVDDYLLTGAPFEVRPEEGYDRALAHLVDGPDHPIVRYVPLPDWGLTPVYGPALKLVQVPAAVGADTDVAILSIGLRDLLHARNPVAFEREIAALTDHITGDLAVPVVWITPPAYPGLASEIRPFALAIRRIATARNIPVADLFTAFQSHSGADTDWFVRDDLTLTKAGQYRAARIIARALLLDAP